MDYNYIIGMTCRCQMQQSWKTIQIISENVSDVSDKLMYACWFFSLFCLNTTEKQLSGSDEKNNQNRLEHLTDELVMS